MQIKQMDFQAEKRNMKKNLQVNKNKQLKWNTIIDKEEKYE